MLQQHVLPRLSCRGLGALLLTCKQLRTCILEAELTSRVADAGRALSKAHPLFRAHCLRDFMQRQAEVAGAVAASGSWQTARPEAPDQRLSFSPGLQHAAAASSNQLFLYGWSSRPATVQLPAADNHLLQTPTSSWRCCKWSADRQTVGWQCQPYNVKDGWQQRDVYLYELSTGKLRTIVLRSLPLHAHERLPEPCFLGASSLVVFLKLQRATAQLLVLSPGVYGWELQATACPVVSCALDQDEHTFAISSQERIAFLEWYSTLCLWQPGSAPLSVVLQNIMSLVWSPCSDFLLVCYMPGIAFVGRQGQVLSSQERKWDAYTSRLAPVWAHQGVLIASSTAGKCSLNFYAVMPGPSLQLQHRLDLFGTAQLCSAVSVSQDHFAVVLSKHQQKQCRQLHVFKTPIAVPALAGGVQVTQIPESGGLVWESSDDAVEIDSSISWCADGGALLCRTPGIDLLVRFC